jgi:cytochrome c-type biogenesis protein CcsB
MNSIMKRILSLFISTKTTLVLLFLFGAACSWGTFLENDYGTPAAKAFIYGAWWFELIMALLALNFIFNIKQFNLLRKEKRSLLLFHLGFIVTLIGAFVSRYTGFEGMLDIREGHAKDYILSEQSYITVQTPLGQITEQIKPTALTNPDFTIALGNGAEAVVVSSVEFISAAEEAIVAGAEHILNIVVAEGNQRQSYFLSQGKTISTAHGVIGFDADELADVSIEEHNGTLFIASNQSLEFLEMATQLAGSSKADSLTALKLAALYQTGSLNFVVKAEFKDAKLTYKTSEDRKLRKQLPGKLRINIAHNGQNKELVLDYRNGSTVYKKVLVAGTEVEILVGPKKIPLGFAIALKDFELIRYPGSTSPSSYSSFIEVQDGSSTFPFHIYMNNVLDYKGFRFFQASYDEDELGTVLSVNHDWWGTWITYLGYFMLGIGMMWSLFAKNSRFSFLNKTLKKLKQQKAALTFLLAISATLTFAQNELSVERIAGIYPKSMADSFGGLLIQDMDGRIKPVNTLASELTRKLTGKTKFNLDYDSQKVTLSANQLFLAIHAQPQFWLMAPVIQIDQEKGAQILARFGKEAVSFISVRDFFNDEGAYLLEDMVSEAYNTKPAERSKHMEEVIKVDERFNILYQALSDSYIKIFPKPGDKNHKWYSDKSVLLGFDSYDSVFVKNIMPLFFVAADSALINGNEEKAKTFINYLSTFQQKFAGEIVPSANRVKGELLYNKLNIFLHLFYSYWAFGVILLFLAIFSLFYHGRGIQRVKKALSFFVLLLFVAQTANMILRWYAGGYPPWSNGYEMIILVSWATMLFGLLFSRRTDFILPLASLFTGTLLFVAFLDWLNPEITNLVPVLKSYWLKIHVAIIVGSYAPLALSALLGFTALWMITLRKKENKNVSLSLKEITTLSEISMTIGIYMLAIGTFLGGVWANESWGRYWGWDPKETWALISILVYAIVLHLRLIPSLKGKQYWYNATSLVAFFSIIMTSFGVNYYLSGLHSYAQGDPVPIPVWVYYLIAIVLITLVMAYVKQFSKQNKTSKA